MKHKVLWTETWKQEIDIPDDLPADKREDYAADHVDSQHVTASQDGMEIVSVEPVA